MAVADQKIEKEYAIYQGDCIEVIGNIEENSIHLSVYSPPFGGLYCYSSDDRDLSNNDDYGQFMEHFGFVVSEINRVTMPGRISAVHCTEIPRSNSGKDRLLDFPGDTIRLHEKHGWDFIARHTIWKEPLWVRNRTMTHNLSHKTIVDDGAYGGVACGDYVLIFRKRGDNPIPVAHPTGLEDYAGEEPIPQELLRYKNWTGKQTENRYSHWIWRHYASGVWDDIRMGRVLPFFDARDPDDEKHVHPLQLDVIDRVVLLRSNPEEVVLTPFMGVGSEVFSALVHGRKAIGIELKQSYYRQAVKNCEIAAAGDYTRTQQTSLQFIDG
jgi:DNA modification methylase